MSTETLPAIVAELERLLAAATPGPWGWQSVGEKSNDAVLGTFRRLTKDGSVAEPIGGNVELEVYDEEADEYREVACHDETIAYMENNANFSDFALIVALRNAVPALLALAKAHAAMRTALEGYVADHDDIEATQAEPVAGPGPWRCGCKLCEVARAALAPAGQEKQG